MRLNNAEKLNNADEIALILGMLASRMVVNNEVLAQLQVRLNRYTEDNLITLENLLADERQEFIWILIQHLRNQEQTQLLTEQLNAWKTKLYYAVADHDHSNLKEKHAVVSTGILQEFQRKGWVSPTAELTDLDINSYLKEYIDKPEDIANTKDCYIFAPISVSESPKTLLDVMQRTADSIKKKNIQKEIKILIPINSGNAHWRRLEVKMQPSRVTAKITDSLAPNPNSPSMSVAVTNVKQAISTVTKNVVVEDPVYERVQRDGFRCGDYTMQGILRDAGQHADPLVSAKNSGSLRETVVKKNIGRMNPKVVNTEIGKVWARNTADVTEEAKLISKIALVENDAKLAHRLDEIYKNPKLSGHLNKAKSEEELLKLEKALVRDAKISLGLTDFFKKYNKKEIIPQDKSAPTIEIDPAMYSPKMP